MKWKWMLRVLFAAVLSVLVCGNAFAEKQTVPKAMTQTMEISKPDIVYQGNSGHQLAFRFEFIKGIGEKFTTGETFTFPSNVGELFEADWDSPEFKNLSIKDADGEVAQADVCADRVVIRVSAGGDGSYYLAGQASTSSSMTARDVGAQEGTAVQKNLEIGPASKTVIFRHQADMPAAADPPVAADLFLKSGWSSDFNSQAASISLEVNPIGSMDLYGSTTYRGADGTLSRKPASHKNMLVEDTIPAQGFIDPGSVRIYAEVPTVGVKEEGFQLNGGYHVPAGVYYAKRNGSKLYDLRGGGGHPSRVTRLMPQNGETKEAFRNRIAGKPLQWGIYLDKAAKTETFFCHLGNVGKFDDGTQNNGILYSDYPETEDRKAYPEIFGDTGASAGSIVSYLIQFNTFYPEIEEEMRIENEAQLFTEGGHHPDAAAVRKTAYVINRRDASGRVRKNEFQLKLVDREDHRKPIADAEFAIQQWENQQWTDTPLKGRTDKQGMLRFGPFPPGRYRVVQLSAPSTYRFNNKTYEEGQMTNAISRSGEFEVTQDNRLGFGSVATNERIVNKPPVIEAVDRTLTEGEAFDMLAGVTAHDPEDGDLTGKIEVTAGNVDSAKPGVYSVTYRVEDSLGLTAEKTIRVTVQKSALDVLPQTGDNSRLILWSILGVLAAAGGAVLGRKKR